jgi:hypothetical protein
MSWWWLLIVVNQISPLMSMTINDTVDNNTTITFTSINSTSSMLKNNDNNADLPINDNNITDSLIIEQKRYQDDDQLSQLCIMIVIYLSIFSYIKI